MGHKLHRSLTEIFGQISPPIYKRPCCLATFFTVNHSTIEVNSICVFLSHVCGRGSNLKSNPVYPVSNVLHRVTFSQNHLMTERIEEMPSSTG